MTDLDSGEANSARDRVPTKRKRRIVVTSAATICLAALCAGIAVAVAHAKTVAAYDAAIQTTFEQEQAAEGAIVDAPQADYLHVERWNELTGPQLADLTKIGSAPAALVPVEDRTPVSDRAAALKASVEDDPARPSESAVGRHQEVAQLIESGEADFTPQQVKLGKTSATGAEITAESLERAEAEARDAKTKMRELQAPVDHANTQLEAIAEAIIADAEAVARAATSGLEHQVDYAAAFPRASADSTVALEVTAQKVREALDDYETGRAPEGDEPDDSSPEQVLTFTHHSKQSAAARAGRALTAAAADYVDAAHAVAKEHDASVAAEAKAAAEAAAQTEAERLAAEQQWVAPTTPYSSGGGGYLPPSIDGYAPPSGGGPTPPTTSSGGGGGSYTPPRHPDGVGCPPGVNCGV